MPASPRMVALAMAVLTGTAGCASIKSTFLERDPTDTTWVPSSAPLNGVPVTIQVPSYVKIQLIKHYHYKGTIALQNAVPEGTVPLVTYDFNYEVIQEKKVVMVDFKRPASGTFQFSADIDPETGYFTNIKHQGVDKTIESIGNQVNSVLGTVLKGGRTGAGTLAVTDGGITSIGSIVTTEFIKVTDPDFENKLRDFVCCSLKIIGPLPCGCDVGFSADSHPAAIVKPGAGVTLPAPKSK